jgi:sortase A
MRRAVRILASVLIAAGVLGLAWVVVVWRWEDPFTALYTHWQQDKLANQLTREFAAYKPPRHPRADDRATVGGEAARFRRDTRPGEAIGRIVIGRIGLNMVVVDGTDEESLKKGPGRDVRSFMPGQGRLVYIAGHRTTYLAPFSHIDSIRVGDAIRLEMPYASFVYRMSGDRIVPAGDLAVLNSPDHELLILQACHPRFFATHRYLVYASLVSVEPRSPPTRSPPRRELAISSFARVAEG